MRLRIIRTSGGGAERERIIGREALVIGRGDDCDWVLPDPERTLSKRHCEVAFQGAVYVLRDTSTNGVFLNASAEPVGRGKTAVLKHGDSFRAAGFGFRVEVVASDPAVQPNSPQGAFAAPETPARPAFVDPGSAIDAEKYGAGASGDPFDAFNLAGGGGPDPLGDAGSFGADWGEQAAETGASGPGLGFGAFDMPAPGGAPAAAIPDDLDLIPLGIPAPDDPWSAPADTLAGFTDSAPAAVHADLPEMAAEMIEALVQLDRQHQAVARLLGLGAEPGPGIDSLPAGTGQTMIAHLLAMESGQGKTALAAIARGLVARGETILRHLEAQPPRTDASPTPLSSFEDDPFE
jgi:predicted component of type VI protein secretion system